MAPDPTDACVMGVDIGGTRTKAVALAPAGTGDPGEDGLVERVLAELVMPTPPTVGADVAGHVAEVVDALTVRATAPSGLAVVVPGLVDDHRGLGVWSASLGWRGLPIAAMLRARFDVPVAVGHDVRAGLLGEQRFGAASGRSQVLFVPIGTGIGSAMMIDGRLVSPSPWSGEIGRVSLSNGELLEHVASAAALGRSWAEQGRAGDAQAVAAEVASGDELAQRLWQQAVDALAEVLAPTLAATGIDLLVVGGGLANAGEQLLTPLAEALRTRLPERDLKVRGAALGDRAAALGAAVLATEAAQEPVGEALAPRAPGEAAR